MATTNVTKEWCLKQCRFYRGEEKCPAKLYRLGGVWASAWFMESLWVQTMLRDGRVPESYSDQYVAAGLLGFNSGDGVPNDLKQFLYGYGLHKAEGMTTADEFRNWYDYEYIPKGNYYRNGDLK